jgi:hypothetical protein
MSRRERIERLAQLGRHRAQALGRVFWLLEDTASGQLRLSEEPGSSSQQRIVQICRPPQSCTTKQPVNPW